jgi:site-specific DNA recombinase
MGAAAHGRNARYRYYVCWSRQRGGLAKCSAERVPADPLARRPRLLAQTFAQPEVITRAVETARLELNSKRPNYAAELVQVQTEMRKADESVQRYLLAFENGTLPEAMCGERMRALADRLGELRARQADLEAAMDESSADDPWANFDVSTVQAEVGRIVAGEDAFPLRKTLLRLYVEEVRIEGKHSIYPVFRVPATPVRLMSGLVAPAVCGFTT